MPRNSIREFLYLDFPKLTSYFAQLHDGNTRERRIMRGRISRDLIKDPTIEDTASGGGKVGAGEGPGVEFSIPKLLGLLASIDAKLSKSVTRGGDEHELSDAHYQVATKELHHEIFSLVEAHLVSTGLVDHDAALGGAPFQTVTGPAELIDFTHLADTIQDWKRFGGNFAKVSGQPDFAASLKEPKALAELIRQFYGGRLGLIVHGDEGISTTYLQPEYLTAPPRAIVDNYGRFTEVAVTVFGLHVGGAYPAEETDGVQSYLEANEEITHIEGLGAMATQIVRVNRSLEGMDRFFRVRGRTHLFPIAVYLDFRVDG